MRVLEGLKQIDIAKEVGLDRSQISKILSEPQCKAYRDELIASAAESAAHRTTIALEKAVGTAVTLLDHKDPYVRIQAIHAIRGMADMFKPEKKTIDVRLMGGIGIDMLGEVPEEAPEEVQLPAGEAVVE